MSQFEDVDFRIEGPIAQLNVARPAKLNAYRNQTADELRQALSLAESNPDVKCLVMSGEGRAFGAGYDLTTIAPDETPQLDNVLERHFNPLVAAMRRSRLPIVAAVNGPCAGAAVGVALAADILVASRDSYFYEPFVGIALVPDAGNTLFLSRMLGRMRASGMMLLGDRISAEQALEWGLAWRVCGGDELASEVAKIATKLASLSPFAVDATKRLIRSACEPDLDALLALERDLQGEAGRSPEMKAAIARFFATRK